MASTTTDRLGLFKATPGTNEPFRVADINDNWDLVDGFADSMDTELAGIEANQDLLSTRIGVLEDLIDGGTP